MLLRCRVAAGLCDHGGERGAEDVGRIDRELLSDVREHELDDAAAEFQGEGVLRCGAAGSHTPRRSPDRGWSPFARRLSGRRTYLAPTHCPRFARNRGQGPAKRSLVILVFLDEYVGRPAELGHGVVVPVPLEIAPSLTSKGQYRSPLNVPGLDYPLLKAQGEGVAWSRQLVDRDDGGITGQGDSSGFPVDGHDRTDVVFSRHDTMGTAMNEKEAVFGFLIQRILPDMDTGLSRQPAEIGECHCDSTEISGARCFDRRVRDSKALC
ncbi:hypothetical protein PG990_014701 [Apiospora arundinis]